MRRLVVAALVALVGLPLFATETACFPQSACDGSFAFYCACGDPNCRAQVIDNGLTWVSGPLEANWLDFPKERVWHIDPRDATGKKLRGRITSVEFSISATENHILQANIGGNNAQWIYYPGDQTLDVQNDTCQDYFVYIVVHSTLDGTGTNACPVGCDGRHRYDECFGPLVQPDAAADSSTDAGADAADAASE